jgi:hypothetical protein
MNYISRSVAEMSGKLNELSAFTLEERVSELTESLKYDVCSSWHWAAAHRRIASAH